MPEYEMSPKSFKEPCCLTKPMIKKGLDYRSRPHSQINDYQFSPDINRGSLNGS